MLLCRNEDMDFIADSTIELQPLYVFANPNSNDYRQRIQNASRSTDNGYLKSQFRWPFIMGAETVCLLVGIFIVARNYDDYINSWSCSKQCCERKQQIEMYSISRKLKQNERQKQNTKLTTTVQLQLCAHEFSLAQRKISINCSCSFVVMSYKCLRHGNCVLEF